MNDRNPQNTAQEMFAQWGRDLGAVLRRYFPDLVDEPGPEPASEAPKIRTTMPEEPGVYVESNPKPRRFEGQAGTALVPELSDVGIRTDRHRRLRGIWLGGEFVYLDPKVGLQTADAESAKDFRPDTLLGDVDEQEPDWHRHVKSGAVGAAAIHHPSDAGQKIEVHGIWTEDWNDDPVMYYVALDGTVSGSALREDVVHFVPIVEWSDEMCEEIAEDVETALVNNGLDPELITNLHGAIADAVLTKRAEQMP